MSGARISWVMPANETGMPIRRAYAMTKVHVYMCVHDTVSGRCEYWRAPKDNMMGITIDGVPIMSESVWERYEKHNEGYIDEV